MNAGARDIRRNMVNRVGVAVRYWRTNGMVREAAVKGGETAWEIARYKTSGTSPEGA